MKLEKINENQIRCTLTKQDLEEHQIRISELAYGSDKAKRLFRDMMQQAQLQFGFEADNIPLMIEAIPVNTESIILIITKVEDPEELDTRFSKFAPFKDKADTIQFDGADNIIDVFQKLYEAKMRSNSSKTEETAQTKEKSPAQDSPAGVDLIRLFTFRTLDDVILASHGLNGFYNGNNILYKEHLSGTYQLVVHQSEYSPEEFNKICNLLSEYADGKAFSPAGEAYLQEHGEQISVNALQLLSQL